MQGLIMLSLIDGTLVSGIFEKLYSENQWLIITDNKGDEHFYRLKDIDTIKIEYE